MQDKLNKVNDQTGNISAILETIEGQMNFFAELIEDMETYPDVAAMMVKNGNITRKLNATHTLINHELQQVKQAEKAISDLSSTEKEVKAI